MSIGRTRHHTGTATASHAPTSCSCHLLSLTEPDIASINVVVPRRSVWLYIRTGGGAPSGGPPAVTAPQKQCSSLRLDAVPHEANPETVPCHGIRHGIRHTRTPFEPWPLARLTRCCQLDRLVVVGVPVHCIHHCPQPVQPRHGREACRRNAMIVLIQLGSWALPCFVSQR